MKPSWKPHHSPKERAKIAPFFLGLFSLFVLLYGRVSATELPQFEVPGVEQDMGTLNELHRLHHESAFTPCGLWDGWLPMATMWASDIKRQQYRGAFLNRRIDEEGYVSMQQHRGMAHSEGWPFPAWQQSTGKGFHFSTANESWAVHSFGLKPLTDIEGWEITGAEVIAIDPLVGLKLRVTADEVRIATPAFRCGTIVAPFARLEWGVERAPDASRASIEWLLEGEPTWPQGRQSPLPVPRTMEFANVPLYRHPAYAGLLTRYRLCVENAVGSEIHLKSIITAIDTRHPITNSLFVSGCCDYLEWTRDLDFLRRNIGRMRRSVDFALREFRVREGKHVVVPWVGHDGRSGLIRNDVAERKLRPGLGVGNNYWDLLPFGGHDAMATIYLHAALQRMERLEESIRRHPEWNVPTDPQPYDPSELATLAKEIQEDFQTRFWNREAGRFFGWIDGAGQAYDYGFTFVNLEAIHYGLASPSQAGSIFDWLNGRRQIEGDTAVGEDIYHWRFAPRATTRRNVETYVWSWSRPESIPWGDQVQDGGAVLGFSYHDLMARLAIIGPEDAWARLTEILSWFREVQSEGGYRKYYEQPGRGTLQGGGKAGGLGLDHEFMESVLVPQVMVYGFLGFRPSLEGYDIRPRLPAGWPSLTIRGMRFHDQVLDVTAYADGRVEVVDRSPTR